MPDQKFGRAFRLVYPDGSTLQGVQFPSGRCVLDDDASGLVCAATDINQLAVRRPGDRVDWADTRFADLIGDFVDDDPCECDHHGYCQAHGWMATEPRCPHARARDLLTDLEVDSDA